jgi:hypothetical protein
MTTSMRQNVWLTRVDGNAPVGSAMLGLPNAGWGRLDSYQRVAVTGNEFGTDETRQ